jgi:hypothetical protein
MQHPEEAIIVACAPQGDAMILFMWQDDIFDVAQFFSGGPGI